MNEFASVWTASGSRSSIATVADGTPRLRAEVLTVSLSDPQRAPERSLPSASSRARCQLAPSRSAVGLELECRVAIVVLSFERTGRRSPSPKSRVCAPCAAHRASVLVVPLRPSGSDSAVALLGEAELFINNPRAHAQLVDAARLSREVRAVGDESLARMRLGEALLRLGDRAGARAQLEGARARYISRSLMGRLQPCVVSVERSPRLWRLVG